MSDTLTRIDYRAELAGWTKQLTHMFCIDLKHIPADAFTQCQGGKARTVADICAEVAGLNMLVVSILSGIPREEPTEAEKAEYIASLTTSEACIQAIRSSGEALAQAISDTSEEQFAEMTTAPWGMTLSKYQFTNMIVNNIWYHDGQLN